MTILDLKGLPRRDFIRLPYKSTSLPLDLTREHGSNDYWHSRAASYNALQLLNHSDSKTNVMVCFLKNLTSGETFLSLSPVTHRAPPADAHRRGQKATTTYEGWERFFNRVTHTRNEYPESYTFSNFFTKQGNNIYIDTIWRIFHSVNSHSPSKFSLVDPDNPTIKNCIDKLYLFNTVAGNMRWRDDSRIKKANWLFVAGTMYPRHSDDAEETIARNRPTRETTKVLTGLLQSNKKPDMFRSWSKSKPGTVPAVVKHDWGNTVPLPIVDDLSWNLTKNISIYKKPVRMNINLNSIDWKAGHFYWPSPDKLRHILTNTQVLNYNRNQVFLLIDITNPGRGEQYEFVTRPIDILNPTEGILEVKHYLAIGAKLP